jgi:cystathionine gamma-lyase
MQAHCKNAQTIAEFLAQHAKVEKVLYPGLPGNPYHPVAKEQMAAFGGMITFFIRGGSSETIKFLENTHLFSLAESLGGVESLIEVSALMTHASIP